MHRLLGRCIRRGAQAATLVSRRHHFESVTTQSPLPTVSRPQDLRQPIQPRM